VGFARRVVAKSVRRATPRPVRKAMHPARTVRNAVTPRPVKQVSRAAYTVRHPVGVAENAAIGAALYPPRPRRRKRGFWFWLTGRNRTQPERPPPARQASARQAQAQRNAQYRPPVARQLAPRQAPEQRAPAQAPVQQPRSRRVEPWPARQAFRTPPPITKPPQQPISGTPSPGQWELDARRQTGLGDGSRAHKHSKDD
jgi:hypothetical protein